jgi:hypothetical protein
VYEQLTVNLTENASNMMRLIAELEDVSETDAVNRAIVGWGKIIKKNLTENAMLVLRYPDGRETDLLIA